METCLVILSQTHLTILLIGEFNHFCSAASFPSRELSRRMLWGTDMHSHSVCDDEDLTQQLLLAGQIARQQ